MSIIDFPVRDTLIDENARVRNELAHGLHPAVLCNHGLAVALESVAARAPMRVELVAHVGRPVEVGAYYVVAEALTNIAEYAGAASATVTAVAAGGTLSVEIADDGVGGADPRGGSGLCGLRDRVEALGGRLAVLSPAGEGTTIMATIPCSPIRSAG
jgi:signal transduction histidine kinase